jgi:hypothetical protein
MLSSSGGADASATSSATSDVSNMATMDFGFRVTGLVFSRAWLALAVTGGACLMSGCVLLRPTSPVLHRPTCDLNPVVAMHLPERIDSLAAVPRDKTLVENGIHLGQNRRSGEGLKEFFTLKRGDVEYEFDLFFGDQAAIRSYEFWKGIYPVFRESTVDGCSGCVHYTQQPRSDPEGGSSPMNYFLQRASFRLHNLVVCVTIRDNKPQSERLTNAVEELAQMLDRALNVAH